MTPARAPTGSPPYRLTNVTVVDTRDGTLTPRQTLHVAEGRIARIDAATDGDGRAIDGAGAFVVPGFVDMHAHPLQQPHPDDALTLMLAFGITGFRQMAGSPELLARRRAGTLTFPRPAPRLLSLASELLTPLNASTPAAAVAEVGRQSRQDADFIKAVLITPEAYFPAQAEATRLGIPLLGHLPTGVDVRAASRAGFRCVEHVGPGLGVLAGCSRDEAGVLAAITPGPKVRLPPFALPDFVRKVVGKIAGKALAKLVLNPAQWTRAPNVANTQRALDTFDEERARELCRQFAADGTWQCPTLIRMKGQELCDRDELRREPDLRYMAPNQRKLWNDAGDAFAEKFSAAQRATFAALFAIQKRLVGLFDEEGVGLLAGTDAVGAAWVVPGASLHDEFDLLTEAGLSPLRVLQSTTLNVARFLGREADAGTVDAGKEADLVLLRADPTASAANLHAVVGVVRSGDYYAASALDAMKEDVARRGVGHTDGLFNCCG